MIPTSLTLADAVRTHARRRPAKVAVVDRDRRLTYGELDARASRLANALARAGLKPGDVISAQMPNQAEFVVTAVAAAYANMPFNPISIRYRRHELEHVIAAAGTRALVVPDAFHGFDHAALASAVCASRPDLLQIVVGRPSDERQLDLARLIGEADSAHSSTPTGSLDDIAVLLLTSGTEDQPKLAAHAERSLAYGNAAIAERCHLTREDVFLVAVPVTSSTGIHGMIRGALLLGATLVLVERWNASEATDLIERERCTYFIAPSAFIYDITRSPDAHRRDLRSLRLVTCGGAPIPGDLVREAREVIGCAVTPMYGASECLAATTCFPDDPPARVTGTDGIPLLGLQLRVTDDDGRTLAAGEPGEILVRGATLFRGYVDRGRVPRDALDAGGWYHTGDVGVLDDEGYVRVVDRKKDVIIRGGVNVSSKEVETFLLRHPEIQQAAVVAMPDPRLGERACAFVVTGGRRVTLDEVSEFLRASGLAPEKWPERIEHVAELPLTPAGKVQKNVLRARLRGLGATSA